MYKSESFFLIRRGTIVTNRSIQKLLLLAILSSFKYATKIFILLAVIPQVVGAVGSCENDYTANQIYGSYPECTGTEVSQLCELRFTELVNNVPSEIRIKLGLHPTDNPVIVSRVVVVWPGNGTLINPPAMIFNDGYRGTAASASANDVLDFQSQWPEAIIMYTEGTRLICYDEWNTDDVNDIPFFSPRFPFYITQFLPTPHTDLHYVDQLTEKVFELFPYDRNRLYAAGHSSGGFFTFSLMEFRREMFRAFAVLGAHADYGAQRSGDIPAIVENGQVPSARPVLYMMGTCENVFPWVPAYTVPLCWTTPPPLPTPTPTPPTPQDIVAPTIRQLTARNGAEVPAQNDTAYLQNLVDDVRSAVPPNQVKTKRFPPTNSYGAEVLLKIYRGDHGWPPKRTDPSLKATEWVVDFFKSHSAALISVPHSSWGWQVPVVTVPLIF